MLQPSDFAKTVVAVPPIALDADHRVDPDPNLALARFIVAGGVSALLYGGNANLYHYGIDTYGQAIEMMQAVAATGVDVITSIGPDLGEALDQAPLVERAGLKNVMLLPVAFPSDSHGVGDGTRRIASRLGHGVILYIKRNGYVKPVTLRRLIDEGVVAMVKYAVECGAPADDPYLDALIAEIGVERLVICHGCVVRVLLERLIGLPPSRMVPVNPASLSIVAVPNAGQADLKLELLNFSPAGPKLDAPD